MKIAIVTYALQVGGVETFIRLLADYFQVQCHKVDLIETLTKGRWSDSFSKLGYTVKHILPNPFRSRIHHAKRIAEILKNYDVVILNDAPFAQAAIGLLPDSAVVIPVLHSNLTTMVQNATANLANWDMLSAVSPLLRDCAVSSGVDEKSICCIPNGIPVPEEWPKETAPSTDEQPLKVIYIGAINHTQKGVMYLPGIIGRAAGEYSGLSLDIVGDGPDMERLKDSFTSSARIRQQSHGLLPHRDAMELLCGADVLIMPSHFEGLPLVLLEAVASGVVPIVSRLPGCTDFVVDHGKNGYLCEIGDEAGFATALVTLAKDRAMLKRLSKSAWETAAQRFSYKLTGAAYLQLAESCRRLRKEGFERKRSGLIDQSLLDDFPKLPIFLVRPVRKLMRILGLYKDTKPHPLLVERKSVGK